MVLRLFSILLIGIIIPTTTILSGCFIAYKIGIALANLLSKIIKVAVERQLFFMGIDVSIMKRIFVTLPISSVAIGVILDLSGIAGKAATEGCGAQMV